MDGVFKRNFFIFIALLFVSITALFMSLRSEADNLDKQDDVVLQTYETITEAEKLSMLFEAMLSAQRGYLLTRNDIFLVEYSVQKEMVSNLLETLNKKFKKNPLQQKKIRSIQAYFSHFSTVLEERAEDIAPSWEQRTLEDVATIRKIKKDLLRVNNNLVKAQYDILNKKVANLEIQRDHYWQSLIFSILIGGAMLLIFNGSLFYAQKGRSKAETELKNTEKRLQLAVEATKEGIFDWDITNKKVYYSRTFFTMLGYDDIDAGYQDFAAFANLLHESDKQTVQNNIDLYLRGDLSEYNQEFRMRHKSGRWMWIKSRAQALFDKNGEAYRMIGAHMDITHLKRNEEILLEEKERAQEASQAKSDFLAHMSHEIRTPLTAISGIAEILSIHKKNLDDRQKKLVQTLCSSTSSLKELITDILDFSKIEANEIELVEDCYRPEELFEPLISMMNLKAAEKGIVFEMDYSALEGTSLKGDIARIKQILINLVGNAIKFTQEGSVRVRAFDEQKETTHFLRIDIIDTGIGIEQDHVEKVFERFKQADDRVSRKFGGTGLGLSISQKLANLMDGDIIVQSEVGKGSTFSLSLPFISSGDIQSDCEKTSSKLEKITNKIKSTVNDKTKALIVEDYEGNIVMLSYIFEDLGIDYDVANNGQEAVDLWQVNHYDFILMDVQMPIMDGFTATKRIRSLERENKALSPTPIIGMTAHALVGDKEKCVEAGMSVYLPKPIIQEDLQKEIYKYIQKNDDAL